MFKFSGNRNLEDIKKGVLSAGGTWHDQAYKGGSDYIQFIYRGRQYLYNACNGRFFTQVGKKHVTESSVEMEKHRWYVDLLHLLYKPLKAA